MSGRGSPAGLVSEAGWAGRSVDAWRSEWDVPHLEAFKSITSTNDRARTLAEEGSPPWSVVIAAEQTRGRGRGGSTWHSASGCGLWMSVLLPGAPAPRRNGWPFLVGLAVAEGIEEADPSLQVALKWPNDLLVSGRKVGGVLCEGAGDRVVGGIGVNVRTPEDGFPPELRGYATSLESEGVKSLKIGRLAGSIVERLRHWASATQGIGHADAHGAWSARDALAGRTVETDQEGRGTARGIDEDGALIVERPDGTRVRVMAGSVRPL